MYISLYRYIYTIYDTSMCIPCMDGLGSAEQCVSETL